MTGAVASVGKRGRVTVNTIKSGINCCTMPMNIHRHGTWFRVDYNKWMLMEKGFYGK